MGRPFTLVGSRHRAHLHLLSRSVSKSHAIIVNDHGNLYIRDTASREHVFVNGEIVKETELRHGDVIRIGSFTFKLVDSAGRSGRKPVPRPSSAAIEMPGDTMPALVEGRTLLIGRRGTCDIVLGELAVSNMHAIIFELDGQHYIRDLGSRTGTFVNGQPIHHHKLKYDDQIRVGDHEMRFVPGGVEAGVDELEHLVGTATLGSEQTTLARADADRAATIHEQDTIPLAGDDGDTIPLQPEISSEQPTPLMAAASAPPAPAAETGDLAELDLDADPDVSGSGDTRAIPMEMPQQPRMPVLSSKVLDDPSVREPAAIDSVLGDEVGIESDERHLLVGDLEDDQLTASGSFANFAHTEDEHAANADFDLTDFSDEAPAAEETSHASGEVREALVEKHVDTMYFDPMPAPATENAPETIGVQGQTSADAVAPEIAAETHIAALPDHLTASSHDVPPTDIATEPAATEEPPQIAATGEIPSTETAESINMPQPLADDASAVGEAVVPDEVPVAAALEPVLAAEPEAISTEDLADRYLAAPLVTDAMGVEPAVESATAESSFAEPAVLHGPERAGFADTTHGTSDIHPATSADTWVDESSGNDEPLLPEEQVALMPEGSASDEQAGAANDPFGGEVPPPFPAGVAPVVASGAVGLPSWTAIRAETSRVRKPLVETDAHANGSHGASASPHVAGEVFDRTDPTPESAQNLEVQIGDTWAETYAELMPGAEQMTDSTFGAVVEDFAGSNLDPLVENPNATGENPAAQAPQSDPVLDQRQVSAAAPSELSLTSHDSLQIAADILEQAPTPVDSAEHSADAFSMEHVVDESTADVDAMLAAEGFIPAPTGDDVVDQAMAFLTHDSEPAAVLAAQSVELPAVEAPGEIVAEPAALAQSEASTAPAPVEAEAAGDSAAGDLGLEFDDLTIEEMFSPIAVDAETAAEAAPAEALAVEPEDGLIFDDEPAEGHGELPDTLSAGVDSDAAPQEDQALPVETEIAATAAQDVMSPEAVAVGDNESVEMPAADLEIEEVAETESQGSQLPDDPAAISTPAAPPAPAAPPQSNAQLLMGMSRDFGSFLGGMPLSLAPMANRPAPPPSARPKPAPLFGETPVSSLFRDEMARPAQQPLPQSQPIPAAAASATPVSPSARETWTVVPHPGAPEQAFTAPVAPIAPPPAPAATSPQSDGASSVGFTGNIADAAPVEESLTDELEELPELPELREVESALPEAELELAELPQLETEAAELPQVEPELESVADTALQAEQISDLNLEEIPDTTANAEQAVASEVELEELPELVEEAASPAAAPEVAGPVEAEHDEAEISELPELEAEPQALPEVTSESPELPAPPEHVAELPQATGEAAEVMPAETQLEELPEEELPEIAAEADEPAFELPAEALSEPELDFLPEVDLPTDAAAVTPTAEPMTPVANVVETAISHQTPTVPAPMPAADEAMDLETLPELPEVEEIAAEPLPPAVIDEERAALFDATPEALDELPETLETIGDVTEAVGEKPAPPPMKTPDAPAPRSAVRPGATPPVGKDAPAKTTVAAAAAAVATTTAATALAAAATTAAVAAASTRVASAISAPARTGAAKGASRANVATDMPADATADQPPKPKRVTPPPMARSIRRSGSVPAQGGLVGSNNPLMPGGDVFSPNQLPMPDAFGGPQIPPSGFIPPSTGRRPRPAGQKSLDAPPAGRKPPGHAPAQKNPPDAGSALRMPPGAASQFGQPGSASSKPPAARRAAADPAAALQKPKSTRKPAAVETIYSANEEYGAEPEAIEEAGISPDADKASSAKSQAKDSRNVPPAPGRRKAKKRRFPFFGLLTLAVLSGAGAAGAWYEMPVNSTIKAGLRFDHLDQYSGRDLAEFANVQRRTMTQSDAFQKSAQQIYEITFHGHPGNDFLYRQGDFLPVVDGAKINGDQLVFTKDSHDPDGDRLRFQAILKALYSVDQKMRDDAASQRIALENARSEFSALNDKLADLRKRIDDGQSRQGQFDLAQKTEKDLSDQSAALEKAWSDATAATRKAKADLDLLQAQGGAPAAADSDPQLQQMTQRLKTLNDSLAAARGSHVGDARTAASAFEAALTGYKAEIQRVKTASDDASPLAGYLAVAQQVEEAIRQINADLADRQKTSQQTIADLNHKLSDKIEQHLKRTWDADANLRKNSQDLGIYQHQLGAVTGAGLTDEAARIRVLVDTFQKAVDARRNQLAAPSLYPADIQAMQKLVADQTEQMRGDQARAEQRMGEQFKLLSSARPDLSTLNDDQQKYLNGLVEKLTAVGATRQRLVAAQMPGGGPDVKGLEAETTELAAQIEARHREIADAAKNAAPAADSPQIVQAKAAVDAAQQADSSAFNAWTASKMKLADAQAALDKLQSNQPDLVRDIAAQASAQARHDELKTQIDRDSAKVPVTPVDPDQSDRVQVTRLNDNNRLYAMAGIGAFFLMSSVFLIGRSRRKGRTSFAGNEMSDMSEDPDLTPAEHHPLTAA
jgi:pSer/pThr/pTyr-binding forkhead associated (FHA) protein